MWLYFMGSQLVGNIWSTSGPTYSPTHEKGDVTMPCLVGMQSRIHECKGVEEYIPVNLYCNFVLFIVNYSRTMHRDFAWVVSEIE